jgi:hypothetical protein
MVIPPKLYIRMTDMAEDLALIAGCGAVDPGLDGALTAFQDAIGWPWRASQEQLDDWNMRRWP